MREVLVTGAFGCVGTAIIDHLADQYSFTYLDRRPDPDHDARVADVADLDAIAPAFEGQDAVVHLAGDPSTDADWGSVLRNNVVGTYNCLEAARRAEVESFVFASSNHVVGMYEEEFAPAIYDPGFDLVLDHTVPPRPDSFYGTSKLFGEGLGRQYVENFEFPRRFYALRIASVRPPRYDHPYGDAERGVDAGAFDPDSDAYDRAVRRLRATWHSRRDLAQLVECCLADDEVAFDTFYGVSDNRSRWFDLEHARAVLGYRPRDRAEDWSRPPEEETRSR
ncbi:NAD-dependent epimerase/dehydratase family protein [Halobium salinum]|uniref:NAD-dependent epimerase/dehydratase family protein n=1 Tax=Halobium salinum TaxID=1364940 RepID=A0ABD5PF37_9EURY|nr:NAD(P)-dependent oxidoreductase [Halobium salinum]